MGYILRYLVSCILVEVGDLNPQLLIDAVKRRFTILAPAWFSVLPFVPLYGPSGVNAVYHFTPTFRVYLFTILPRCAPYRR